MERKITQAFLVKADEPQGIVEHIVSVMGNIDEGYDMIHNGAFAKTINERGGKIRCLDNHQTDSVMRAIGKPLEMREIERAELPDMVLSEFPEATGGLLVKTQFLMNTPEGKGAFERIRQGAVDEWSIGYESLDSDYSKAEKDGKEITVRNLRTIKLYEYSPVLWGMNQATATLNAKKDEPEGAKPYRVVREGERYAVYKIDEEGEPDGDALGVHDTEAEAAEQVRALYAAEEEEDDKALNLSAIVENVRSVFHSQFNTDEIWNYWCVAVYDEYVIAEHIDDDGTHYYSAPYEKDEEGKIAFAARETWTEGRMEFIPIVNSEQMAGPDVETNDEPPTTTAEISGREKLLELIEIEQETLELWRI